MKVIYEPKGKALEYAPLAANLFRGCGHGCKYCYAPGYLRMSREEFAKPTVRPGVLEQLEKDAKKLAGDLRPVLLCFTCDPYQHPLERKECVTRRAIEILGVNDMRIRVLTKNPALAIDRDIDILKKYDVDFGVSMSFVTVSDSIKWEPGASLSIIRRSAISNAKRANLRTWVSVEPVIDPGQAIEVIDRTSPCVDHFKIGKLNHHPEIEKKIDWRKFLRDVLVALEIRKSSYYIKDDLWAYADGAIRERWSQSSTGKVEA